MSNLRIVTIITNSNRGGAQEAIFRLSEELRRRGHEVEIWFLYGKPFAPKDAPAARTMLEESHPGLVGYLRVVVRLLNRLRMVRPDVVISFLPLACIVGQTGAWLAGVRCRIASQRNPYWSYGRVMQACDWLAGTLGMYTCNVANSRSVMESFARYPRSYRRYMSVVYNGINWRPSNLEHLEARKRFQLRLECPLVVTIGRLTEQKNQALLLNALSRLPAVHLALAGDGHLRQALIDEAQNLGIANRVHFLGTVNAADVRDLLRAADIFALPSRYEGQSNALLEAMSEGLPILASDVPSQAETLRGECDEPAGWLLPVDDPASWAQVIEELIADPIMRAWWGNLARQRVTTYSLERMGNGFERAIHESLGPKFDNGLRNLHPAPRQPPRG